MGRKFMSKKSAEGRKNTHPSAPSGKKKPRKPEPVGGGPTDMGAGEGDIGLHRGMTGITPQKHTPGVLESEWEQRDDLP